MSNDNYKSDKLQIQENMQNLAVNKFQEIEKNTESTPIAFLRQHYNFVKIREAKKIIDFNYVMAVCWSKICGLSGIKTEVDSFVVEDISKMIANVYSDLSIEEIYKAFELERHGVYESRTDHFQFFSSEYVSTILKKYRNWRQEMLRRHYIKSPEKEVQKTISIEEQTKIMDDAIIRLFDEFLESGDISIPCGHVFDEIYSRKMFKKDMDFKEIFHSAKRQVESEIKQERATNSFEKNKIKEALESLKNPKSEKVLAKAKQLALKEYFEYLKSINKHVKDFLHHG